MTIQEAAHRLGVKEDAIHKRIQRGSMRHEKADDGRVYVWVDTTQDTSQDADRSSQDAYQDTTQDDRLEDLREQIAYLRRQLAEERDARRRADMILAQLSQANSEQARTIRAIEAPQEASEASEPGEEQQGRVQSPGPMPQARRRPYNGRGGGECSEDRRSMHNDQTTQDAKRLLAAMSINHSEARMDTPYGLDRPFSPSWADAEEAGLDRVRRDAAVWWLIDNNLLEREEEAENLRVKGEGLPEYDYIYGSVFRITDSGRELLEEIWEERRQQ